MINTIQTTVRILVIKKIVNFLTVKITKDDYILQVKLLKISIFETAFIIFFRQNYSQFDSLW